ncbi:hypothetical protein V1525DRAFT_424583 [Lipomyces kononenkoae]|uniref:Uncharacterized protein n=1 Tax=Lipomyces kononenkoae TaxID=34357 RepID=A0ACC3T6R0_LIPKO
MSVIDDLDSTESAARGRLAWRQVAELYISRQPAKNTRQISSQPAMHKRAVRKSVLTTKTRVALSNRCPMEQSDLMSVVRGPLSPDTKIEVPASWDEYELAQELLDTEGNNLANSCNEILQRGGISQDIRRRVTQTTDVRKHRRVGRGLTIREWDGALRYLDKDDEEMKLMVAFEVGLSQSYRSLQEAITWSVCALHCCLGIAMCLNEGLYYANEGEATAAIQRATAELRLQLRQNPFGPLVRNGVTWFGALEKVVIEIFRCEDANCPPGTMLAPTRSFLVIMDGQSSADNIPPNIGEVVLGDCVPSHVLSDHEIRATPIDFFPKSWLEAKIRSAILETAVERIENRCLSLESTGR